MWVFGIELRDYARAVSGERMLLTIEFSSACQVMGLIVKLRSSSPISKSPFLMLI